MTEFPTSGIKLVADTTQYTKDMEAAIFLADYFDSLGDLTISIAAEVDTASFEVDLPQDGETIDVSIDAEVDLSGETLPFEEDSINVGVDANVETTGDPLPFDGETIDTELNVTETDTAAKTLGAIETIKNLKVLETVWNIVGTGVDLIKNFGGNLLQPMLDLDSAVARVNATTGNAIPNARELIKNIFYDDLGESIDQVSNLVTKAGQLKLPIDEAVRSALTFTHTFQDQNPEQVLDTLNQMVINHLAPNFKTAGDMLTVAFQNGANKGNDLLTAINNNATAIQGLGLTGPQALSFIKTGLDAGFKSADDVLKALEKIKQNVTNAAGNATSDVTKTLKILGIANPAETGEAWTADFFKKVIDGINNAPGLTDSQKEAMFTNLIGGKQGGKTFSAFLKLSPEDADNIFANMQGASDRAATEIDNSLSGAIDDFMLAANKAAQDFLSSEQIDLPGKITALKTGIQDALDTLSGGGTLGEALTVALKPIGFDDEFQGLEAVLGNFVIAILQVVSAMQALDPAKWEAKKGTDAAIANLSATQLTFDLKVGNPEDVSVEIATAVSRGVTPDKITSAVGQAVNELVAEGSDTALKKAQALVDTLSKPVDQNKLPTIGMTGTPINVEPVVSDDALSKLKDQINNAFLKNSPPQAVADATTSVSKAFGEFQTNAGLVKTVTDDLATSATATVEPVTAMNTQVDTLATNATTATQPITNVNTGIKTTGDNAADAAPALDNLALSTQTVSDTATAAAVPVVASATAMDAVTASAGLFKTALDNADISLRQIIATAGQLAGANDKVAQKQGELDAQSNTSTTPKKHALGTPSASGTFIAGDAGPELVTSNRNLAVLNNKTTEAIMAALQGWIPGGSMNRSGGNTYTVNQANIIQSEAQADALGYSTAKTLRGMG